MSFPRSVWACVASCGLLVACGSSTGGTPLEDSGARVDSDAGSVDAPTSESSTNSSPGETGGEARDSSIGGEDSGPDGESVNTSCPPYTVSGDSNFDSSTGLTWRNTLSAPQPWSMANADCAAWGGRLPTKSEATNLVKAVEASSCAMQLTWPEPPFTQSFWTSTPDPQNTTFYYGVFFGGGMPIPAPEGDGHWVVCVKGTDVGGDP